MALDIFGVGTAIGEIGGEAIETTGEVARAGIAAGAAIATKLLTSGTPAAGIPTEAIPNVAGTTEGTKQLRLILRARTREAKINARAQMVSTFAASPIGILMAGFGSMVAFQTALIYIRDNAALPSNRSWAAATLGMLPSIAFPLLPNSITGLAGSTAAPNPLAPITTGGKAPGGMTGDFWGDLGYHMNRPILDPLGGPLGDLWKDRPRLG